MTKQVTTGRVALRVVAWTAVGVIGLTVASAAADAVPSSKSSAQTAASAQHGKGDRAARKAIHGDFVRSVDGAFATESVQRGAVTAVTPTSITLKSADGFTRTYVIDKDTKVHLGKKNAAKTIADVPVDAKASVFATKSGDSWIAKRIVAGLKSHDKPSPTPST